MFMVVDCGEVVPLAHRDEPDGRTTSVDEAVPINHEGGGAIEDVQNDHLLLVLVEEHRGKKADSVWDVVVLDGDEPQGIDRGLWCG